MKEILLTKGYVALVDDDDFELISKFNWSAFRPRNVWYAKTCKVINGVKRWPTMHRLLLGLYGPPIDHINGNGLDNRRANLRLCSLSQNLGNMKLRNDNHSGFKGVSWDSRRSRWVAFIQCDHRAYNLGSFGSSIDAAHAYDTKARELFGEFAKTNF